MSTLDKKLAELIQDITYEDGSDRDEWVSDQIGKIKQAFVDEGYIKIPAVNERPDKTLRVNGKEVMTGQEWYDRFEKEYHMRADWISSEPEMGDDAEHDVLLAARLAAGL